ncbi:MAG: major capsid protein, partial [Nitrososphaerota archaeon]
MKQFQRVRLRKPKSSVFNLSHEKKLTMNMGDLVPVFMEEVIPSDSFRVNTEALVRMMPMTAPIMHRVNCYIHYFFVPYRIIWDDFEKFITGGETGIQVVNFPKIQISSMANIDGLSQWQIGSLADYLGIPVQNFKDLDAPATPFSQLPFRAYQQIYNDYYRDQNFQDENEFSKGSSDLDAGSIDANALVKLQKRNWEKDYFTTCLPFAQRGDQVRIPLLGSAPVSGQAQINYVDDGHPVQSTDDIEVSGGKLRTVTTDRDIKFTSNPFWDDPLSADLSEATSASINDLRTAFSLQRWMEKMARGGSRYVEQMLHMFGQRSSDARLQRAEYLGGGKLPVSISEVQQMSATVEDSPQGNLAGHGVAAGYATGFKRRFEEHGIVLGIMSIMPRTAYMQGLPRLFSKFDRFDYAWPDFAHIGEQEIPVKEVFYVTGAGDEVEDNEKLFGYQERYAEYRFKFDSVHGDMRDSLKMWHMARDLNENKFRSANSAIDS